MCRHLTENEVDMIAASSFTALPHDATVAIYHKLHLKKTGRVISSTASSRSFLRDNSGLAYHDSHGSCSYGKLFMIFVFEDDQGCAIIIPLHPSGENLCKDSITGARIDDHIVSLHSPRYYATRHNSD